jgi:hypothetical protein
VADISSGADHCSIEGPEACGCRPREPDGKPQGPNSAKQVIPSYSRTSARQFWQ